MARATNDMLEIVTSMSCSWELVTGKFSANQSVAILFIDGCNGTMRICIWIRYAAMGTRLVGIWKSNLPTTCEEMYTK